MFGFSLSKLLFTVAVVLVVWYGFKMVGRLDRKRKAKARKPARQRSNPAPAEAAALDAEDMIACSVCGTYVSALGARSCGRDDCPYPG